MAQRNDEFPPPALQVLDSLFCIVFTTELIMRLAAHRQYFFTMNGWKWNWLDFILVMLQLLEEIASIIGSTGGANLSFLRVLRILRLLRAIRLARVLRLVRQLRTLVCSIAASMQSLAWTVLLIAFLIYVVAIYFTQLTLHTRIGLTDEESAAANQKDMVAYYGSLLQACLSLFQAITGGVDWDMMLRPLVEEISPLVAVIFSFYIAFSVLAMMNVVTGVFVEAALQSTTTDKEEHITSHLRELFQEADSDGDNRITYKELDGLLARPNTAVRLAAVDIKAGETRKMFMLIDVEDVGEVAIGSLIMGLVRLQGSARSIDLATLIFEHKRFLRMWKVHAASVDRAMAVLCPGWAYKSSAASSGGDQKFDSKRISEFAGRPVHSLAHFAVG